jgi:hypothetical protein
MAPAVLASHEEERLLALSADQVRQWGYAEPFGSAMVCCLFSKSDWNS